LPPDPIAARALAPSSKTDTGMTLPQGLAFAIVGTMMILFVWGRLRYDVVAALALVAAVVSGIVPADKAFSGFGDDVVIIVASALLVSAAIAKSGVMEEVVRPLGPYLTTPRRQVFALVFAVVVLSTFIKNVGALAILMPVAFQLAKRTGTPPSWLLMPLASGSLIGGLITLVGTSPNVIVARVRADIVGEPFRMFDYAPVGLAVAAVGLAYLTFAYRLLPKDRQGGSSLDAAINIENYVVEAAVPEGSPLVGKRAAEIGTLDEGVSTVTTVVRDQERRHRVTPGLRLKAGDILLIEGEPDSLERAVVRAGLQLSGPAGEAAAEGDADEVGTVEAVVTGSSPLVGETHGSAGLCDRFGLDLIAISRSGERITERLRSVRFRPGDVVVIQGRLDHVPDALKELGLLPLAERELELGRGRRRWIPVAVLALAIGAIVSGLLPIAVAFFAAAVLLVLTKALALREAYEAIEWPIVVLLGALIPVSDAVRTTGATDLIAGWLSVATAALPPTGALALIMVAAMAVTPFLNNAATVLVMAPIAASLAGTLGLRPDPFLMAVAIGAACDFLTPFGHQSNTLVMGPGGYRFGDYWRLGLPLSLLVVVVAVPAIAVVWPLSR
jgi:di/tricarboxylate transporter